MDYKINYFCTIDFTLLKEAGKLPLLLDNIYELAVILTSIHLKVILDCQFQKYLGEHSGLHAINEEAFFYCIISLQYNGMEQHIYIDYTFDNFQCF